MPPRKMQPTEFEAIPRTASIPCPYWSSPDTSLSSVNLRSSERITVNKGDDDKTPRQGPLESHSTGCRGHSLRRECPNWQPPGSWEHSESNPRPLDVPGISRGKNLDLKTRFQLVAEILCQKYPSILLQLPDYAGVTVRTATAAVPDSEPLTEPTTLDHALTYRWVSH